MRYRHDGDQPVYAPNSHGGPQADPRYEEPGWLMDAGEIVRTAETLHAEDDDFGQPGALWRDVLSETDRDHLVANIVGHAGDPDVKAETKPRVVAYWASVDPELGARVAAGLGHNAAGDGPAARSAAPQAS
jgi:catalase